MCATCDCPPADYELWVSKTLESAGITHKSAVVSVGSSLPRGWPPLSPRNHRSGSGGADTTSCSVIREGCAIYCAAAAGHQVALIGDANTYLGGEAEFMEWAKEHFGYDDSKVRRCMPAEKALTVRACAGFGLVIVDAECCPSSPKIPYSVPSCFEWPLSKAEEL